MKEEIIEITNKDIDKIIESTTDRIIKYEKEKWIEKTINEVENIIKANFGADYGSPGEEDWGWIPSELPPLEDFISYIKSCLQEKLKNL